MELTMLGVLRFLCWYRAMATTLLYNQTSISGTLIKQLQILVYQFLMI